MCITDIDHIEIIYRPIDEIYPYENNPRKNDSAVDAVAASIKEFGFKVPIILDDNNEIIAGHTRLKAAKKLGYDEVPTILADDLSPDQVKAFRLADNKVGELAEWDDSMLNIELDELFEADFDMGQFGFGDAEELDLDEIESDKEKTGHVIVSINCPSVGNWNSIEDEIKRIAAEIDASVAVKME